MQLFVVRSALMQTKTGYMRVLSLRHFADFCEEHEISGALQKEGVWLKTEVLFLQECILKISYAFPFIRRQGEEYLRLLP